MVSVGNANSLTVLMVASSAAIAGPPYVTDDAAPTDPYHYEIYLFANGENRRDGSSAATGIDFNYGASPDLQLTAAVPVASDKPRDESRRIGFGNVELAAKYRFLHQSEIGWDVAAFPRIFLPSGSGSVGDRHASLLLPLWLERDGQGWSTFGGGGCVVNRGGDSRDFCLAGWAVTQQVLPDLQLGLEVTHQTPDTWNGRASTTVGAGLRYDTTENLHLLAYAAPGLQNAGATAWASWYTSLLFTF
jgi:hypothetical protein